MKPRFGICKNKVGCSFAYTGEKIPVTPDLKCPECGQPLVVESSKRGSVKVVLALGILLLLVLAGGGAALFAFKDQIFHLALNKPDTTQKLAESQIADKEPSPSGDQETSATPPANTTLAANTTPPASTTPPANVASTTPDTSSAGQDRAVVAPTETPALSPQSSGSGQDNQRGVAAPVASPSAQPEGASPGTARRDAESGTGAAVQPPPTLTRTEVDATREDVLKRINAMPRFTAEEKKRLGEKMQTARSMDRLLVIRFDTGQTTLNRAATDDLIKRFKSKDVEDKIGDPTVVFVVAGYADAAGDPKTNLQISQQRADNVTKALKEKTDLLNVVHSVGMGSTDLLDSKRADQNRAVEVWAVAP